MKYSDTSNKNGLIQVCESLAKLGDGGISNDATLLKQFTNYINIAIGEVRSEIMKVDHTWRSDDYNYTDYPDAPIALVAGQKDYELPVAATGNNNATLLRVTGVYVLLSNNRIYLRPMTNDEVDSDDTAAPWAYRLEGKTIWLNLKPSASYVTTHTNLHVEFQRLDDPFVSGDTTQQPGFVGTYHHLLAFRAVSLYMLPLQPDLGVAYGNEFRTGLQNLKEAVASMNLTVDPAITSECINFR